MICTLLAGLPGKENTYQVFNLFVQSDEYEEAKLCIVTCDECTKITGVMCAKRRTCLK